MLLSFTESFIIKETGEYAMKKIYLAGGCFWGVEHFLSLIDGITATTVGYANSDIKSPSYEDLKVHRSSAAETVETEYDENMISLKEILDLFFMIIDPTLTDQQGHDIGHQYRTGIYYTDEKDLPIIRQALNELSAKYSEPIRTELLPLENFTRAEEYHQDYLIKNPQGYCHVDRKMFEMARNYRKN